MATTLALVNRVRRLLREEDAAGLTDRLSVVLLDLVNEAKGDLLEDRIWDFDRRQDGVLFAKGEFTETDTAQVASTLTPVTLTTYAGLIGTYTGDFVSYVVVSSDTTYGDTAFRLVSGTVAANHTLTMANGWAGATDGTASARVVIPDYLLPTTVRAVTSVRHQEGDIRLHEITKETNLDWFAPRPHEHTSDLPTDVYVGSTITTTFDTDSASAGTTGIGLRIHPAPSSDLVLHYSYIYRHPTLSTSQGLDNVDASVEDGIVRLAFARAMLQGIGNEPATGALLEREVLTRMAAIHEGHDRDPMRRSVVRPHFSGRAIRGGGFGRLPRNFGSL